MAIIKIGKGDALVVIDAQNDFVSQSGALYVSGIGCEPSSEYVLQAIIKLASLPFVYRATTEDDHPPGHIEFSTFPPHCVCETSGQKYVFALEKMYECADENITKGLDKETIGHSVVVSIDFPGHLSRLRVKEIKRIFVVGWAYTHCVGESAIAYASQGFEVYVVRDATRSVPPEHGGNPEVMKQKLALYGVKEITMADIEL